MEKRIQPIEESKKTIAAIVQERIRAAILDGLLAAGSRIDQNKLAADLNVSIVPVREALKKLDAEGFVRIIPRRGAFVTDASVNDMEDLYFARRIAEGQAAYHAAEKLTEAHIEQLEQVIVDMTVALQQHDYERFMGGNRRFHFIIYDAAGSHHLSNIIASLWELAERYRYRYILLKDQGPIIQAEHQTILDACRERDGKKLRDAIVHHMNQTLNGVRTYIMEVLPERRESN
jgi:DNA-binding GntR family transcriptional regulator